MIRLESSVDEVVVTVRESAFKIRVIQDMIEYFRMRIGVIGITSPVDIVLVDVTAVQSKSKVCVVHHIAPGCAGGISTPQLYIINAPVDSHPISILDIGFKDEIVDVVV